MGTKYTPKIISYAQALAKKPMADLLATYKDGDQSLCALLLLVQVFPPNNSQNKRKAMKGEVVSNETCSRADADSYLIQFFPVGSDIDVLAKQIDATKYTQPIIIGIGPRIRPVQYFIVVDFQPIQAGSTIIEAFDMLFKVHYVFDVHFAPQLDNFYGLFQTVTYAVVAKPMKPQLLSAVSAIGLQ
ncbi:uncharacterized protein LOC135492803 [Lineus longissimus]|uniref:uncharacterized protein LOC135492803 n=1 Tax=Lineus longissimus TaxID=88925 RepID=UPI00315D9F25